MLFVLLLAGPFSLSEGGFLQNLYHLLGQRDLLLPCPEYLYVMLRRLGFYDPAIALERW
jgi:hypothetical protein